MLGVPDKTRHGTNYPNQVSMYISMLVCYCESKECKNRGEHGRAFEAFGSSAEGSGFETNSFP